MITMSEYFVYYPEILANVFPSKFCTINFKCWLYLRGKYLRSDELRVRTYPPLEDCPGDAVRELPSSTKVVVDFDSPLSRPTYFCVYTSWDGKGSTCDGLDLERVYEESYSRDQNLRSQSFL